MRDTMLVQVLDKDGKLYQVEAVGLELAFNQLRDMYRDEHPGPAAGKSPRYQPEDEEYRWHGW